MEVIRGESFYDWCQRTGNQSFLLRWDYDKNCKDPKNVCKSSNIKYYFKCEAGIHESSLFKPITILRHNTVPKCPICNSFGFWCDENNKKSFLQRWDYKLNECSPYDISISSTKKMYFKCPKGIHPSEKKNLNNMRKQNGSSKCIACDSIGQWGIDNIDKDFLSKYISEDNNVDLMKTSKSSMKKIVVRCQNTSYHPDYNVSCANFKKGERCPYCSGKKVAREDSLGYVYPQSLNCWVEKKRTPFDYLPKSNKSVYWICDNHGQYKRKICDQVEAEFVCPKCSRESSESKLQKKVREYLASKFKVVNHEYQCTIIARNPDTNYLLPYDNEVVDLKLIIEVNGEQHYKPTSFNFWNNGVSPQDNLKYRKKLDKIKKIYAISNGYNFLEIPYWTDNKKETWKMLIDRKIESIRCSTQTSNANSQA